jgi:hypothetical protein
MDILTGPRTEKEACELGGFGFWCASIQFEAIFCFWCALANPEICKAELSSDHSTNRFGLFLRFPIGVLNSCGCLWDVAVIKHAVPC